MALTYTVSKDNAVILSNGDTTVDTVGPFDSSEGANIWGTAVCEKYNSAEYADTPYPNELAE